ncbi:1478_t:CDS:1, partial [Scutellospora calospora]
KKYDDMKADYFGTDTYDKIPYFTLKNKRIELFEKVLEIYEIGDFNDNNDQYEIEDYFSYHKEIESYDLLIFNIKYKKMKTLAEDFKKLFNLIVKEVYNRSLKENDIEIEFYSFQNKVFDKQNILNTLDRFKYNGYRYFILITFYDFIMEKDFTNRFGEYLISYDNESKANTIIIKFKYNILFLSISTIYKNFK